MYVPIDWQTGSISVNLSHSLLFYKLAIKCFFSFPSNTAIISFLIIDYSFFLMIKESPHIHGHRCLFVHSDIISEFWLIYIFHILFALHVCVYVWVLVYYSESWVIRGKCMVLVFPFYYLSFLDQLRSSRLVAGCTPKPSCRSWVSFLSNVHFT